MHLTGIDLFFWATGLLTHAVLLFVLFSKGRARHFPFFTALIAANVLRTAALYVVMRRAGPLAYFYAYWSMAILDVVLQLCVVAEVTFHVFRPLGTWAPQFRRSSALLLGGSFVVAAGLTWIAAPPTSNLKQLVVIRGSLFSAALMSELFVGMVALSVSMGLPWRTHVARVAQGFGVYSVLDIVLEGIVSLRGVAHGRGGYTTLAHLRVEMYQLCVLYWIVTLARKAPSPQEMPERMRNQLFALQARIASDLQVLRNGKAG